MPSSPTQRNLHASSSRPTNSINVDECHQNHPSFSQSGSTSTSTSINTNASKPGLFERLKVGTKRKNNQSNSSSPIAGSDNNNLNSSPNNSYSIYSPFNLAQRIRALLDVHPVNSPAPTVRPLPPLDSPESPHPTPIPHVFSPVILPGSPFPLQHYDQLPGSPVLGMASVPVPSSAQDLPFQSSPASLSAASSPSSAYFSAQLPSSPAHAELVALLSSPELMNGSIAALPVSDPRSNGVVDAIPGSPGPSTNRDQAHIAHTPRSPGRRESVWGILDRIGSPKARARRLGRAVEEAHPVNGYPTSPSPRLLPTSPAMSSISSVLASSAASDSAAYGSDGMRNIAEESSAEVEDEDEDDTSMMLYSPLMPTSSSVVSVAESEIVSVVAVNEDEEGGEEQEEQDRAVGAASPAPEQTEVKSSWTWSNLLSFSSWFPSGGASSSSTTGPAEANSAEVGPPPSTPHGQPSPASSYPSPTPTSPRPLQPRVRRRRVWVPSRTQLSLETMWWGYRIYIPPPVLESLDTTSVETNRRAALLTAALTWFFSNFPVHVLPLTVRPVIIILQGLVPYLGYLGGLLSWSWGTIRSYDEGYGIILTATWVVPIALIPSTWAPPPPDWPGSPLSSITAAPLSPAPSSTTAVPTPSPPPSSLPPSSPSSPRSLAQPHTSSSRRRDLQQAGVQQHQPFPTYLAYSHPSVQQELDQAQRQPIYSPYAHPPVLSPLPLHYTSFSVPEPNSPPYPYQYGYPPPAASPVMVMSTIVPMGTNGAVMYSSTMAPVSASPGSYVGTITPGPASPWPLSSTTSKQKRRSRRKDGDVEGHDSLCAPRMATVPLPDDDR